MLNIYLTQRRETGEIDALIARTLTDISPIRAIAQVVQTGTAGYRKLVTTGGTPSGWVSETAARLAYQQAKPAADRAPEANAADLALAMIDQKVLRDIAAADAARLPPATLAPVTLFTVLLWLQSERPEDEDEAALDSAADLAMVLAPDVTAACAARDATRLAALFAEFASHV